MFGDGSGAAGYRAVLGARTSGVLLNDRQCAVLRVHEELAMLGVRWAARQLLDHRLSVQCGLGDEQDLQLCRGRNL